VSELRPSFLRDLPLITGVISVAFLLHVVPWWGIALHTDVIPTYRLQVSGIPGLAEAVPYGLQVATAYPMGAWDACLEGYRAYSRFSCMDVLLFRATAWAVDDDAHMWRIISFATNAASVALFLALARTLGASRTLAAAFGLSLIAGPLEIWAYYHAAEPKATLFLLLALFFALRAETVRQSALAATLMALACLTKETFAVTWVAVLAALLYRRLSVSDAPPGAPVWALLANWRLLAPHALAMLALGAFVGGLLLTSTPRANYALNAVAPYPPLRESALIFWTALQPALVRELLTPTLAVGVIAVTAALAASSAVRDGLLRAWRQPRLWLLVGGLLAAVVLHGLIYYLAKRPVDDSRYVLPANVLFCLACVTALAPLGAALTARFGWLAYVTGLAVSLTAASALLWRLGRQNEAAIIGVFLAVVVGLAALGLTVVVAALTRRRPQPVTVASAVYAGVAMLLLVPTIDNGLSNASAVRVNGVARTAFSEHLLREAPPNGHVVLRVAEPYMIEDVWATEASTLLAGRLDLTYHLEVEDLTPLRNDNGLVRFLIDAYNSGRRPLPASDAEILFIRARRDGMKHGALQRTPGYEALWLLLRSPAAFFANRYVDGRTPAWEYEMSHGRPPA